MFDPIVKRIEVPCSQEKAFNIFVGEMITWWPVDRFTTSAMSGKKVEDIRVEAKEGGTITEVSSDGSETHWGRIKTYDPFGYVAMDFHIPNPKDVRDEASLVEVTFTVLEAQRTMVELKQSNWEAFGDKERAEGIWGGYNFGWGLIFEQGYKAACES